MLKFFKQTLSPSVVIAVLLGSFSTFLAYKGEYEAAMAGAGVAVAAATSRSNKKDESDSRDLQEQLKIQEKEHEIQLLKQSLEQQAKIKELEHKIELLSQGFGYNLKIKELELALKFREQVFISPQTETNPLSEFKPAMLEASLQEATSIELSEHSEENPHE